MNLPICDLNEIAKKHGLFEKKTETNEVDTERLTKIVTEEILRPSIIVGHLAPYVLEPEKINKVIVLRKNPHYLIQIYKKRGYSNKKIKDNAGSEVLGIILYDAITTFGKKKIMQIDVSEKTVDEVSKKVIKLIKNQIPSESIDWLSVFKETNDLKKFFSY